MGSRFEIHLCAENGVHRRMLSISVIIKELTGR